VGPFNVFVVRVVHAFLILVGATLDVFPDAMSLQIGGRGVGHLFSLLLTFTVAFFVCRVVLRTIARMDQLPQGAESVRHRFDYKNQDKPEPRVKGTVQIGHR
jgi:p-aminobenzoyl-glutamate transporter AbgT